MLCRADRVGCLERAASPRRTGAPAVGPARRRARHGDHAARWHSAWPAPGAARWPRLSRGSPEEASAADRRLGPRERCDDDRRDARRSGSAGDRGDLGRRSRGLSDRARPILRAPRAGGRGRRDLDARAGAALDAVLELQARAEPAGRADDTQGIRRARRHRARGHERSGPARAQAGRRLRRNGARADRRRRTAGGRRTAARTRRSASSAAPAPR